MRLLCALSLLLVSTTTAQKLTPQDLVAAVSVDRLRNTLTSLDAIAKTHGGNRAFDTPGYNASLDFILSHTNRLSSKFDTHLHRFTAPQYTLFNKSLTGPDGKEVFAAVPYFGPPTPLPDGITGLLVNTPVDDERGSMCLEEQWVGVEAKGRIALVKRGLCPFAQKLELAKKHGALAVIVYNNNPGNDFLNIGLGSDSDKAIPIVIISFGDAQPWISSLNAGEDVKVTLIINAVSENRPSWNIISQTKAGDANKVIMLGAHLDSVVQGPGINDDGSGSALVLELMEIISQYDDFPHAVRFGWWGNEEGGLVGSTAYVDDLAKDEKELDKIKLYFNYDMVGSMVPSYYVARSQNGGNTTQYMGDVIKAEGATPLFTEYGDPNDPSQSGNSDYYAFIRSGIPIASIHTGGGDPADVCYHQACDTIDNINWDAMRISTKAAASGLGVLINSLDGVPPRTIRKRSDRQYVMQTRDTHGTATCSHAGVHKHHYMRSLS
ncbi:hypothetical protein OQA88_1866 [Cercophora sp. LCS_1]